MTYPEGHVMADQGPTQDGRTALAQDLPPT